MYSIGDNIAQGELVPLGNYGRRILHIEKNFAEKEAQEEIKEETMKKVKKNMQNEEIFNKE